MFIDKSDLDVSIRTYRLDQITDGDDNVIEKAILSAQTILSNSLFGPGYDTNAILTTTGDERDQQLIGWCIYITLYKIYERVPDSQVPERVVKNYDDTMDLLKSVSAGKLSLNLPRREDTNEQGKPQTKFQWGSQRQRRQL